MRTLAGGGNPLSIAGAVALQSNGSDNAPRRSDRMFTSRVVRNAGDTVFGGTAGTGNIVLTRNSLEEAQAWGANRMCWTYLGSSDGATVASWVAAGYAVQGTINTSPSDGATVLPSDWAGNDYTALSNPFRPAPFDVSASPRQRFSPTIAISTLCDPDEAAKKKASLIAAGALGVTSIQVDDPRDLMFYIRETVTHPQMETGFRTWLLANTTLSERNAQGLPDPLPAGLVAWMTTDPTSPFYSYFHTGLTVPAEIDAYRARVNFYRINTNDLASDWRAWQVWSVWYGRYIRETVRAVYADLRAEGLPLSANNFRFDPSQSRQWSAGEFEWNLYEVSVQPAYPSTLEARLNDVSRIWLGALCCDARGIRGCARMLPAPPLTAPAGFVRDVLKQQIATLYAMGINAVMPWDTYMTAAQGVSADNYRFMADPADYTDLYGFVATVAHLLDGFQAVADIGLAASMDQWPDAVTASEQASYALQIAKLRSLLDVGVQPKIYLFGSDWVPATPALTMPYTATLSGAHEYRSNAPLMRGVETWANVNASALASAYGRVVVSGSPGVRVFLRSNGSTSVVHLVNYSMSSDVQQSQDVTLSGPAISGRRLRVWSPGASASEQSANSPVAVNFWTVCEIL